MAVAAVEVAVVVVVAVVEVAVVKVAVVEVAVRSRGGRGGGGRSHGGCNRGGLRGGVAVVELAGWKLQESYELQGESHRRSRSCTGAPWRFPKKGQRAACAAPDPHTGVPNETRKSMRCQEHEHQPKGQTTPRIRPRAKASVRCQKHDHQPKGNDPKGSRKPLGAVWPPTDLGVPKQRP